MKVSEAFRSLTSVPPLLRTIENIPDSASPSDLVDISMVDQLNRFAGEVTRVAREVGTEGRLGGQANVPGVAGTWKDLTDNVNFMAGNLTGQVRNIAEVATAIANGDLSRKITVDVRGEILQLKETLNTMAARAGSWSWTSCSAGAGVRRRCAGA